MKKLLILALILIPALALAEGGKNREKNPVLDQYGNVVGVVEPNLTCSELESADNSQVVYLCEADKED